MRFCDECGTLIHVYDYLCPRCGKTVDGSVAKSLSKYLQEKDYNVDYSGNYVVAKHKDFPHIIMVKLVAIQSNAPTEKGNTALTLHQFRLAVSNYLSSMKKSQNHKGAKYSIDFTRLNQDVITAFGWHASSSDKVRHEALVAASAVWGEEHIIRVLEFLRNTWQNNPIVDIYYDTVVEDCNWFNSTISGLHYRRYRDEAKERIEYECKKAFPKSSIFNQSWFGKKHRFVVSY